MTPGIGIPQGGPVLGLNFNQSHGTPPKQTVALYNYTDQLGYSFITSTTNSFTANQWQYVTVTSSSNNTQAIYINGTNAASGYSGNNHGYNVLLLGLPGSDPKAFSGSMTDVRIYDRALSSNEVSALYTLESTPPTPSISFTTNGSNLTVSSCTLGGTVVTRSNLHWERGIPEQQECHQHCDSKWRHLDRLECLRRMHRTHQHHAAKQHYHDRSELILQLPEPINHQYLG